VSGLRKRWDELHSCKAGENGVGTILTRHFWLQRTKAHMYMMNTAALFYVAENLSEAKRSAYAALRGT